MLWEEYYDKIGDWATSTAVRWMSKPESFDPQEDICIEPTLTPQELAKEYECINCAMPFESKCRSRLELFYLKFRLLF